MERLRSGLGWRRSKQKEVVVDGSDIKDLVQDEAAFGSYVDRKFCELDVDGDGKLSVQELQPAVADIGAVLGLPPRGASPESEHIYSEVLNEFTHGKQEEVSKTEFKDVLSDILLGVATGLNRVPIVILRLDGKHLEEYIESASFELEQVSVYSEMSSEDMSLRNCIKMAMAKLTVDHGMPPPDDSWVNSNIVEPALRVVSLDQLEQPATQEIFLEEFKKVMKQAAELLKEQLVIVAHSENTFDGNGIKRLLANKFELDKLLDTSWTKLPKEKRQKVSKEYLRIVIDEIAPSAGLPPYGATKEVDAIMDEAFRLAEVHDGKPVRQEEFNKLVREVFGSIMLQLTGKSISVSSNSVVHEPFNSQSTITLPSSSIPT